MSVSPIVSQLRSLVQKSEFLGRKFSKICPSNDQWQELLSLSQQFAQSAISIQNNIKTLEEQRSQRAWAQSEELRLKIESSKADLLDSKPFKRLGVFRRNIVAIYCGPKVSRFDSEEVRSRKEMTGRRSEEIRSLEPDGLVLWALSFAPTTWAAGTMASDVFDCLLKAIAGARIEKWPSTLKDTLQVLKHDESSLSTSSEYDELLEAVDQRTSDEMTGSRKRQRTENDGSLAPMLFSPNISHGQTDGNSHKCGYPENSENTTQGNNRQQALMSIERRSPLCLSTRPCSTSTPPSEENREMKYMYANCPVEAIMKLPNIFQGAVQNSRLWKWERNESLVTTGCISMLFPKDNTQDVSVTLWCGHNDGYHLINSFGAQHVMSS